MYLLILFLPLSGFIFSCILGKFLGKRVVNLLLFNMFLCVFVTLLAFYEVGINKYVCFIDLGAWFHIGVLKLNWIFIFDSISTTMSLLVISISFLVHLYSTDYMSDDPHITRFLGYLSLFTFFMLMLITAGNFVQLFLGWEGVGLSSYLLINFWYTRIQANKSAMKAMIVNRFGDFGIYFSLLLIFFFFKSFDFSIVFGLSQLVAVRSVLNFLSYTASGVDLICFFLFLGAVGKSAQLGLHTWLPDAMEGPTPVSALIHAATMVTAGVFVIIRSSPILEYSGNILFLISLLGGLTTLFAGTVGLVQYDIKKVIAYSTCSQLGYMFFACGMSNYSIGLFHLFNHGFFKALLFLGAGSVIHALLDEQDMRKMGGLVRLLPLTYVALLAGSFSLTGFPFFTGFYSKEIVLEIALSKFSLNSYFIYWLGITAAFITSLYSIRLIYLVFLTPTNSLPRALSASHESSSFIFYILTFLSFLSIFIGFAFRDLFIGLGTDFWGNSIFQLYQNADFLDAEFLDHWYKLIPLVFSILGMIISSILYFLLYNASVALVNNTPFTAVYFFLNKKWFFDLIYNIFVFKLLSSFYTLTFKLIDRGLIEFFGPLSIARSVSQLASSFSFIQTGHMYSYIFAMLLGIVVFLKIVALILAGISMFANANLLVCFFVIITFSVLK